MLPRLRKVSGSSVLAFSMVASTVAGSGLLSAGCDDGTSATTGSTGGTSSAGGTGGTGGSTSSTGGVGGSTGGTSSTGGLGGGTGGTITGGSGGTGGAADPTCFDYSTFDGAMPAVGFKDEVLPILQVSCGVSTSCHGDPNAPNESRPYLGPNKAVMATAADIDIIFNGIVDISSYFEPGMSIVATGDPEHSFLMHKLDGTLECALLECAATQDCGALQPLGSDILPLSQRDLIRRWIAQGAKNN